MCSAQQSLLFNSMLVDRLCMLLIPLYLHFSILLLSTKDVIELLLRLHYNMRNLLISASIPRSVLDRSQRAKLKILCKKIAPRVLEVVAMLEVVYPD